MLRRRELLSVSSAFIAAPALSLSTAVASERPSTNLKSNNHASSNERNPIRLRLGNTLLQRAIPFARNNNFASWPHVQEIVAMRQRLCDRGFVLPLVRITDDLTLEPDEYVITLNGDPVVKDRVIPVGADHAATEQERERRQARVIAWQIARVAVRNQEWLRESTAG